MNTNCGLNENGALVKDAVDMIGEIKILAQSSIPSNCLPCNGAAISRAAYPELFAAIGTTYGAGASVAEGLPNITGRLGATNIVTFQENPPSTVEERGEGCIRYQVQQMRYMHSDATAPMTVQINGISIVAALSNSIYGASTHVQPQGITFNVVIVFE